MSYIYCICLPFFKEEKGDNFFLAIFVSLFFNFYRYRSFSILELDVVNLHMTLLVLNYIFPMITSSAKVAKILLYYNKQFTLFVLLTRKPWLIHHTIDQSIHELSIA
jgi:hypothetical protein